MTPLLYYISLFLTVLLACHSLSYEDKMIIEWIDQKRTEIDRDSSLSFFIRGYLAEGDKQKYDGGYLKKYLKNDSLVKVELEGKLSYGISGTIYYYWKNRLIYARTTEKNYPILDSLFQYDYRHPIVAFEIEAYFNNGRFLSGKIIGKRKFKIPIKEHPRDLLGSGEFHLQEPWYLRQKK